MTFGFPRPTAGASILHSLAIWSSIGRCPSVGTRVSELLSTVDVVWVKRGAEQIAAMFEVEHSTPVYSGLLRFNDFHLIMPTLRPRFSVVSNDARRSLFVRQINRPTFKASGLGELCTFLEYANVYDWWRRLTIKGINAV